MKLKKILAAIAAFAVCSAMMGVTAFAAPDTSDDGIISTDDGNDGDDGFDDDDDDDGMDDGDDDDDDGMDDDDDGDDDGDDTDGGDVDNNNDVSSPKTGNSPIALAVIPAALAAAAVVAKKAK